jgi:transposase InsO family protein
MPNFTADDVYTLIASGVLYIDMSGAPIAEPERVRVFRTEAMAQSYLQPADPAAEPFSVGARFVDVAVGKVLTWDGVSWTIVNLGEGKVWLRGEDSALLSLQHAEFEELLIKGVLTGISENPPAGLSPEGRELLNQASLEDCLEADKRFQFIMGGRESVEEIDPGERTIRDWRRKYKIAEIKYGWGYLGLLSKYRQRGNRLSKLPEATQELLKKYIKDEFRTLTQKRGRAVYNLLCSECETKGTPPPSYRTFCRYIEAQPRFEQERDRKGDRAAYEYEQFYWELELTTPRHGDYPFHICHIDHTQLDVECVDSRTGRNLGRPWITILSDAFTRRILAIYISFDPPSYRSNMMVLRICVRRFGRLPRILVVDGGKDFHSTYFDTLLARYEVIKKTRPGAKSRYGSVLERLFRTMLDQVISNLRGNTQITRNVRQVTKANDPKRLACWTLGPLYARVMEWAYEVYDIADHPALGQSPREAFANGILRSGKRRHRIILYDETFVMATLPTTDKGRARVQIGSGVQINYIYYWNAAFRSPEVERSDVAVRFDPFNAGIAYAYVQGRWVKCVSEHFAVFQHYSARDVEIATEQLRIRRKLHEQNYPIRAKQIADFLNSLQKEEGELMELRRHTSENREALALIEGNDLDRPQMRLEDDPQPPDREDDPLLVDDEPEDEESHAERSTETISERFEL